MNKCIWYAHGRCEYVDYENHKCLFEEGKGCDIYSKDEIEENNPHEDIINRY